MANIFQNKLQIQGCASEIQNVFNSIKGKFDDGSIKEIDFNSILPYPDDFTGNGKEWIFENWGAKESFFYKNDDRNTSDTIFFIFAYSCPWSLIQYLSTQFPNLTFILCSTDMDNFQDIVGKKAIFKNGDTILYISSEIDFLKAQEIYFEIYPDSKKDFTFKDNKYTSNEFYF